MRAPPEAQKSPPRRAGVGECAWELRLAFFDPVGTWPVGFVAGVHDDLQGAPVLFVVRMPEPSLDRAAGGVCAANDVPRDADFGMRLVAETTASTWVVMSAMVT